VNGATASILLSQSNTPVSPTANEKMYFQENRKQCKFHQFQFYDQSDPFVKFCICGKRQDGNEPKKTKFNNRQTEYGGVIYHSQKEADYAAELDLRLRAKDIDGWER
jgi:hypothetical protein